MQSWQVLFWLMMMYGVLCGVPEPITVGMSKNHKTIYVMIPAEVKKVVWEAVDRVLKEWKHKMETRGNRRGLMGGAINVAKEDTAEGQQQGTDLPPATPAKAAPASGETQQPQNPVNNDGIIKAAELIQKLVYYGIEDIKKFYSETTENPSGPNEQAGQRQQAPAEAQATPELGGGEIKQELDEDEF